MRRGRNDLDRYVDRVLFSRMVSPYDPIGKRIDAEIAAERGNKLAISDNTQSPKWWKELTDAEKIERMHDVVKILESQVNDLQNQMNKLCSHDHTTNGLVVIPIHLSGVAMSKERNSDGETWFWWR